MNEQTLIDRLCHVDRRRRQFPIGTACKCGEWNPLLLVYGSKPTRCYACLLDGRGFDPFEEHHEGGRPSEHKLLIPANPHALLTFLQGMWRDHWEPGSDQAYLFDHLMLRALGPSIGIELA
jgi:hypothetical protein